MSKLEKLPEGGDAPLIPSTEEINKLIQKLNALIDTRISPQGLGEFKVSDGNAVLDLAGIKQFIMNTVQEVVKGGAGGGEGGGGGSGGGTDGNPPGTGSGGGAGSGGGGSGGSSGPINGPISASGRCLPDGQIEITIRTG